MRKVWIVFLVLVCVFLAANNLFATPPCPSLSPGANLYLTFTGNTCNDAGGQCTAADTLLFNAVTDLQPCGGLTYHWDFGDLTSADGPKVAHGFATPGTYTVKLVVTEGILDSALIDSALIVRDVTVSPDLPPPPSLPFDFAVQRMLAVGAISPNGYVFTAVPASNGLEGVLLYWDFGDGTSAIADWRVTHIYQNSDPHVVTLTAVGYSGNVQHLIIGPHHRPARH